MLVAELGQLAHAQQEQGGDGQPPHAGRPGTAPGGHERVLQRTAEGAVQAGRRTEACANRQRGVERGLGEQPAGGAEPADDGTDPPFGAGRGEQRAGPGEQERAGQRRKSD